MKIEASLLRPVVDIKGDVDFCVNPHLTATVKIPPLDIKVDVIPFSVKGDLKPDIKLHVDKIPINLTAGVIILGFQVPIFGISGSVGPIDASVTGGVGFGMEGSLGGITSVVALRDPISMDMNGCIQGLARLNPKNLQLPECCEDYREPFCCSCHVHKDHKYCDKGCGCHPGG